MHEIIDTVRGFDGAGVFIPQQGSEYPEMAWGDAFFYYAPDGVMPQRAQPYATIVTKDYPDDTASRLDEPGRFRVNIHGDADTVERLVDAAADPAEVDVFFRHPLYGTAGWICVINPGAKTSEQVVSLLRAAHDAARARAARRHRGA